MDEKPKTRQRTSPDPRTFFVVWSPEGGDPVIKIPTFDEAKRAAWRLSERNPDRSYFVLRSCWGRPARAPEVPAVPTEIQEDGETVEPA
jgi:hypothetical protein